MGKLHKCIYCSEWIKEGTPEVQIKTRYAHQSCFNTFVKTTAKEKEKVIAQKAANEKRSRTVTENKKTKELKDGLSEEEYAEKVAYYDMLKRITGEEITAKQRVVSERYLNDANYKFTYTGMCNAIEWYYTIEGHEVKGDVVGLLPYIYNDAQQYYQRLEFAIASNKDKDITQMYHEKTVAYRQKPRAIHTIDISHIGTGEAECKD